MLEEPMEVMQKICGFLGVNAPEKVPRQPFLKQSSGDTRSAMDSDSWEELYTAFKHTERASDFKASDASAPCMPGQEHERMQELMHAVNARSEDIAAASVSVPNVLPYIARGCTNIEQQKLMLSGRRAFSSEMVVQEAFPSLKKSSASMRGQGLCNRARVRTAAAASPSSSSNLLLRM